MLDYGSNGLLARLHEFHGPNAKEKLRPPLYLVPFYQHNRARRIILDVCKKHGVQWRNFFTRSRVERRVRARWEAAYRLRTELKMSLPAIGKAFGGMHHTTILHAIRQYEEENGHSGAAG